MGTQNPVATEIIAEHIKHLTRGPFILTIIYFILYPWYQIIYDNLSSYSFMKDAYIFALMQVAVHMSFYWPLNLFFLYCDTYKFLQQYKLPRLKSQLPSKELIHKTIKFALIGQLIIEPLGSIFLLWPAFEWHGSKMRLSQHEKPTFLSVFMTLILSEFVMEWLFYFIHRLVHHPKLYGPIHKQHHEYKGSIGFAAEYANPIEGLAANLYPTFAVCLHIGAHPLIFFVYLFWRLWETYESHSGYSFRGTFLYKIGLTCSDQTLYHDFHHTKNIGNYAGRMQDWVMGTDTGYNKWLHEWEKQKIQ
eukprot:53002_1